MSIVDSIPKLIRLYCDNLAVVMFSKNNRSVSSVKHLEVKYLTIKKQVRKGEVVINHIGTEYMNVDPLTKGLRPKIFRDHVTNMRLVKSFDALG